MTKVADRKARDPVIIDVTNEKKKKLFQKWRALRSTGRSQPTPRHASQQNKKLSAFKPFVAAPQKRTLT